MDMSYYSYDRAFITGCDINTEWQLEWFLKNYRKHNETPIIFCNFGISPDMLAWVMTQSDFCHIYEIPKQSKSGWFYKPAALLHSPAKETVWLDTDMQILGDVSGAFDYIEDEKLAMVEDKPWSKRRGETWHNSGTVGIRNKPQILKDWYANTQKSTQVGDQEVLHEMVKKDALTRMRYITDLPNKYNWLRIQLLDGQDSRDKLVMHWTGHKGKLEIRKQMYNG